MELLKNGERLDDLEFNGMFIISNKDKYCFTSDSVMLANKVRANSSSRIVDLCSGAGIIALLIGAKTKAKEIIGVEIQKDLFDMASRSIIYNNLSDRISMINDSIIGIENKIGIEKYDAVVCNPPYYKSDSGETRLNDCVKIARHEITVKLTDVVFAAEKLLKYGGKFYIVHKCERMSEVLHEMTEYGLEPKELYLITTNKKGYCDTFIAIAKKGAKSGLKVSCITHD